MGSPAGEAMTIAATGPLAGIRVVEIAGMGPLPYACMLLAELGADVLRVDRPGGGLAITPANRDLLHRSRPCAAVDLKHPAAREVVLRFVEQADVFVEGLRPGVVERLGIGPEPCLDRNPRLVYGRMTGWGHEGPFARVAGHDINFLALTGALHAIGPAEQPLPPLNLVADFGGGSLFLVAGVLAALLERGRSGRGQVVDAAMVDGASSLITMVHGLLSAGLWRDERAANLMDGGVPYYSTYECADGRHVAVGALEPRFYANLLAGLELQGLDGGQNDRACWPAHRAAFSARFATRTRDDWAARFAGADACVTPVLSLTEAADHPHMAARNTFVSVAGVRQPAPAPRFSRTPGSISSGPRLPGQDSRTAMLGWGFAEAEVDRLLSEGVVSEGVVSEGVVDGAAG
jgi:alpha-methylacyl-CoA racemase